MAHKEEKRTSMHLRHLQQGPDETLRSYVKKFNMEAGKIPDLPDGIALDNFVRGLKKGTFKLDLINKNVRTMADALSEAEAFMHATEICSHPYDVVTIKLSEHSKFKSDHLAARASNIWAMNEDVSESLRSKRERPV
ncbi:uncharacterized protein [Spinacia oleracea]|uniref:Retrotransposon gag domain-containing protein n=1 Tax=Spinacia oleracea TaxID=3562 RepID=A0A9R0JKS1_SPIOL|nr:uncharacterized protein LOC110777635 [Spinacia oleracea]